MKRLRVVNKALLNDLTQQVGRLRKSSAIAEVNISIDLGPLKLSRASKESEGSPEFLTYGVLEVVVEELRARDLLRLERPMRASEFWESDEDWYVWEPSVVATPVRVPLPTEATVSALTVWVLEPQPGAPPKDEWDWTAAFAFVVQEIESMSDYRNDFVSGISALRMVVDFVGRGPGKMSDLLRHAGSDDPYGRHPIHPVDKLRQAGGIPGSPRKIETIYKIAYMSDEQMYPGPTGEVIRTNDILAYPLYIFD